LQQKRTKILYEIINVEWSYHERYGLGYNQIEKGSSSMTVEEEVETNTYVEVTRGSTKKEE
jgi:hypothetical protein